MTNPDVIAVNFGKMQNAVDRLMDAAKKMQADLDQLDTVFNQRLFTTWFGPAADACKVAQTEYNNQQVGINENINNMGSLLGQVREDFIRTEHKNTQLFSGPA